MNSTDLLESVQDRRATELSRLGSSKVLFAATDGELGADRVLRAAADAERRASETFSEWADDETHDAARTTFRATADEEEDHFERVRSELDDYEPSDAVPALPAHLRTLELTVERAGALLGRVLVARESKTQFVGYFVGDADPGTASVFRELKADLDDQEERVLELLTGICADDSDWQTAADAADEAIRTAYDDYVTTLESLGINPKPVC